MSDIFSVFGADVAPDPEFTPDRDVRDWSYFDFLSNREAFAMGQSDARPYIEGGCYYRLRGRTVFKYTLLAYNDADEAWAQLCAKKAAGHKVQVVNYTYPRPKDVPTVNSHTEFWAENFTSMPRKDGKPATKLCKVWVKGLEIREPTRAEADSVFDAWAVWAKNRHFMVFKGHYQKWIDLHLRGHSTGTRLLGYFKDGKPVGLYGYEVKDGVTVIIVAKHLPDLKPDALWVRGLEDVGDGYVLCGSTADRFKARMGLHQRESWTFDLKALPEAS